MGMDLMGKWRKGTPQEVKDREDAFLGQGAYLHYNWTGWEYIRNLFESWGVNTEEFSNVNDGQKLSLKTCKEVAEALETNWESLSEVDKKWLEIHKERWKWTMYFKQN